MRQWYYVHQGDRFGPVSEQALVELLQQGTLRPDDLVWTDGMADWVMELAPGEPVYAPYEIPDEGEGAGLTGAPRGALGHWVRIEGGTIDHYQCVVPTTWNASPKDEKGRPGPVEQAIVGTAIRDEENPFEIVRIVRSFDPCLACAVHVITPRGGSVRRLVVS
jgi:hydrogenase large subunit